jgi:phage terminase large subunit-like protein
VTRGERVIEFIHRYCRVPEGAKVGEPIVLAEFQRKFIIEVYDNPAGTRRAYLAIARKNGKSALIACLLLAHLAGPEKKLNSQIVSGARSRDQAALVFSLAAKMVSLSEELSKVVRIVPSGKRLIGLVDNVEYRALAAEGTTAHGLSPVLAILDEVGQIKGEQDDFIDAITTSQGAHDAPLLIAISTQAPTDADLFSVWLDDAERSQDPAIVSHVYTAPEGCEVDDEAGWAAANPALGLFRSRRDVEEQAAQAKRMPAAENTFRVLTLNQRVNMVAAFVSAAVWKAGNREPDDEVFLAGPVYGGLDLSGTTDLTALVLTARDLEGTLHVRPYFWMPQDTVIEAS